MSIENLLKEEIKAEIGELGKIAVGTDEYKTTVNGVSTLMDKAIEMDKLDVLRDEKAKELKLKEEELALKEAQLDEDKKDHFVKNCITGGSIVVSAGVAIWGALKSWKFEETGTVTSSAGRNFIGNLFKMKR